MIQGVLFDLGYTLLYFDGSKETVFEESTLALIEALQRQGLALDPMAFAPVFRHAMDDYAHQREIDFRELTTAHVLRNVLKLHDHADAPEDVIQRALESMYAVSEWHWRPMPNAHAVLDELCDAGYRLGVLSNAGDEDNVLRLLAKAELEAYFEPILISAALGIRKPDPKPFELVLQAWNLPPGEVVMIGDTLVADILGAQRVGMRQIWMRTQVERPDNLANIGHIFPDAAARDLAELPILIERL